MDIPQMKWECISMDFVTGLPRSLNYNAIFVVVDMLTKVAHLIPARKENTAKEIAQIFMKHIFALHGLPCQIVSDRDSKFTRKFWKALFEATWTTLAFSTAYSPQIDG